MGAETKDEGATFWMPVRLLQCFLLAMRDPLIIVAL